VSSSPSYSRRRSRDRRSQRRSRRSGPKRRPGALRTRSRERGGGAPRGRERSRRPRREPRRDDRHTRSARSDVRRSRLDPDRERRPAVGIADRTEQDRRAGGTDPRRGADRHRRTNATATVVRSNRRGTRRPNPDRPREGLNTNRRPDAPCSGDCCHRMTSAAVSRRSRPIGSSSTAATVPGERPPHRGTGLPGNRYRGARTPGRRVRLHAIGRFRAGLRGRCRRISDRRRSVRRRRDVPRRGARRTGQDRPPRCSAGSRRTERTDRRTGRGDGDDRLSRRRLRDDSAAARRPDSREVPGRRAPARRRHARGPIRTRDRCGRRRYGGAEMGTYHLTPAEHRLDPDDTATLAAAYGRLARGAVEGGERAPSRAVRSVADADQPVGTLADALTNTPVGSAFSRTASPTRPSRTRSRRLPSRKTEYGSDAAAKRSGRTSDSPRTASQPWPRGSVGRADGRSPRPVRRWTRRRTPAVGGSGSPASPIR